MRTVKFPTVGESGRGTEFEILGGDLIGASVLSSFSFSLTPTQLIEVLQEHFPTPLLLSLDPINVCRDLGQMKTRTQRGTRGGKKPIDR